MSHDESRAGAAIEGTMAPAVVGFHVVEPLADLAASGVIFARHAMRARAGRRSGNPILNPPLVYLRAAASASQAGSAGVS